MASNRQAAILAALAEAGEIARRCAILAEPDVLSGDPFDPDELAKIVNQLAGAVAQLADALTQTLQPRG